MSITKNTHIYDFVVLGGGIAGLYTVYQIIKREPKSRILLLEKANNLGGRIHTYCVDQTQCLEAGAGRFTSKHHRLIELIRELGLSNKMVEISSHSDFVSSNPQFSSMKISKEELIQRVVKHSNRESAEYLQSLSLLDYAKTILSETEIEFLKASFGYYTELVVMNAYDGLHLISFHLSENNKYFALSSGLSQIVEKLEQMFSKHSNIDILKKRSVKSIVFDSDRELFEIFIDERKTPFVSQKVICSLPKQVLEKIDIFRPIRPLLKKIICAPLCRIYSKYPINKETGEPWFSKLSKITTDNHLRMVIPINNKTGWIMISYTDNKYSEYWNRLYETHGKSGVDQKTHDLIKKTLHIDIPKPEKTFVFHWGCGVGYWGINVDSRRTSESIMKPFSNDLYICGEHFSSKNQQWIEGALETSSYVISKIFLKK